ncbi:diguanylate cyclase [Rhodospira trueperi]|uniref:Diguanylate cyclase (GGDEF) domain-containing protein n=1 Tax=Rhodospira trueperi TaxID=69960 RepID=A0A1G7A0M5_9PROT|nr:diguanylate cyclase [Rhodospira trueperi]SDE08372.1 diguanylate cyclase (GGDEF) domain-containing protein [Rhodospira trueperi]
MPQYAVEDLIYQGHLFRYLRAFDHERGQRVIVKAMNADDLPEATYQACHKALEREFQVLSLGDGDRILRPNALGLFNGARAIVFDDQPGRVLSEALREAPIPWTRVLSWAVDIADALQDLHGAWIVHRNVNPTSFLWSAETDNVHLMDAAVAVRRDPGLPYSAESEDLVGVLSYISPEQTGRTGSPIDHRSDLYSLGVMLFEGLTGEVPFRSQEPLEVVHAHLTRPPPDVSDLDPRVPGPVAAVVGRLLAKDPHDRYQSAFGLRADLEALLAQARTDEPLETVRLHAADPPSDLRPPARAHGRNQEIATLRIAHDRARLGGFEVVLIAGESGSGKTRLVRELEVALDGSTDRFVSAKLDPSASSVPYLPIRETLGQLVSDMLAQDKEAVAAFRDSLPRRLDENAALAAELVPGLATLLPPATKAQQVPTHEAQARAFLIVRELLQAFTAHGRALVLFFDDLQWADVVSLQTLAALGRDDELHHLLIVGTYRDNEVQAGHPLRDAMADLEQAPVGLSTVHLSRLGRGSVTDLVAECLRRPVEDVADLARVCFDKTLGNPFFLTQFLQTLIRGGRLAFDHRRGRWDWSPGCVERMAAAENVADLMVERLHSLPEATKRVLVMNACADAGVGLKTLAALSDQSLTQTVRAMAHAMDAGLVEPTGRHAGIGATGRPSVEHPDASYRFVHDRIQEAALALLDRDERTAAHLRIGRTLRDTLSDLAIDDHVFQLMYHFQWARALLDDPSERLEVAGLALLASRKAATTGGFGPMLEYARLGLALLPEAPWDVAYTLTLGLHEQAVAGAYITHQTDVLDAIIQAVLDHAATPLDKTLVVQYQILRANADGAMAESIDIGLAFLEELGVSFPRHPTGEDIGAGLGRVQAVMADRSIEDLASLPEMTDPTAHRFMRICNAMAGPTFNSEPTLFLCMVFKQVEWFVRHGNSADAVAGYSTYAMALCVVARQYEQGQAFGELAFKLADRFKAGHVKGRLYLNVYLFVHHWRHHLTETLAPLMEGYRQAYSHGDVLYASLNSHVYCHHTLWVGTRLAEVEATMAERLAVIEDDCGHHEIGRWTRLFQQTVRGLRAGSADPVALEGEIFDERVSAPGPDEPDKTFVLLYHLCKLILAVTFEDKARIPDHVETGRQFLAACNGIVIVPVFQFFGFMGRVMMLRDADAPPTPDQRREIRAAMDAQVEDMRQWAEHGPMNFAHKHAAMAGLLAWLDGDRNGALDLLDAAIDGAKRHGYLWDQAVIQEWLGRVCLEEGRLQVGAMALRDATRAYASWGAGAKVAHMKARHGPLLTIDGGIGPGGERAGEVEPRESITHLDLDLGAVLKASQAIGAEIVLSRLLDRMMQTVLENAGADRGMLLRTEAGSDITLWAEKKAGEPTRVRPDADGPVTEGLLPLALVNRVRATRETVIVPARAPEGRAGFDVPLERHHIRSALCLPIRARDEVVVLLYLENRVTPNAFTEQRVAVLDMLAGQIAVSLENARLYEKLEARVAERTRELQEKMSELSEAYESVTKIQIELEAQAVELRRANDITEEANRELLEKNAIIQRMASTDALTGLCNRRFFDETLVKELERAKRYDKALSMAIVDIDHFKRFNDRYGHACGDRVLETVARVLTARVRSADTVARWGGEEFCILMPETDLDGARTLMEDIRAAIAATRLPDVGEALTASAGVAALDPADPPASLFQRADEALYAAKEHGRNQVRSHQRGRVV